VEIQDFAKVFSSTIDYSISVCMLTCCMQILLDKIHIVYFIKGCILFLARSHPGAPDEISKRQLKPNIMIKRQSITHGANSLYFILETNGIRILCKEETQDWCKEIVFHLSKEEAKGITLWLNTVTL
jgi:hypothetical protein